HFISPLSRPEDTMGALYSTPVRVLLLGLDNCGKTTLLRQLTCRYGPGCSRTSKFDEELQDDEYEEDEVAAAEAADSSRIQPTFGCVGAQIRLPCGGPALAVVEVGGRRLYRDFWRYHCAGAEAVLFVVDSNDSRRLDEARSFLFEVATSWELLGVPVIVLANKQDLPMALPSWSVAAGLQMEMLERLGHPTHVHRTVGSSGDGVLTALHVLARLVRQRRRNGC
ncbi:hypothetical protein BOX15_Mlig003553g1, partial [Macrostomum lignano]